MRYLKTFESNTSDLIEEIKSLLFDLTDSHYDIRCDVSPMTYERPIFQICINLDLNLYNISQTLPNLSEDFKVKYFEKYEDKLIFVTTEVKNLLNRLESCDYKINGYEFAQSRNNDYYEIFVEKIT